MTLIGKKDYQDIGDVAKDYQLSRERAIKLLFKYGDFSNPEIMKALMAKPVKKSVTINGVKYDDLKTACEKHNISMTNLRYNLKNYGYKTDLVFKIGKSVNSGLYYSPKNITELKDIEINNKKYRNIYDYCSQMCLTKQQFINNLRDFGDQSSKMCLMRNSLSSRKVVIDDQVFRSKSQLKSVYAIRDQDWLYSERMYGLCKDAVIRNADTSLRFSDLWRVRANMPVYLRAKFDQYLEDLKTKPGYNNWIKLSHNYYGHDLKLLRTDKVWEFYEENNIFNISLSRLVTS